MAKMFGRIHGKHCDCNTEWAVSGKGEKCNYRYGNKRQRSREKREWKHGAVFPHADNVLKG